MVVSLHETSLRPGMRGSNSITTCVLAFQGSAPAAVRIMAVNFTGEATLTLSATQKPPPPPGATALAGTRNPQVSSRQSLCTCAVCLLIHWICAVFATSCCMPPALLIY